MYTGMRAQRFLAACYNTVRGSHEPNSDTLQKIFIFILYFLCLIFQMRAQRMISPSFAVFMAQELTSYNIGEIRGAAAIHGERVIKLM